MESHLVSHTDRDAALGGSDTPQLWIRAIGGVAIVLGALLHWAGPVAGTQTNVRALWDPALVRDATVFRTIGFAMVILGVVAVIGAITRSTRMTSIAGLLAVVSVLLFGISILRGSGNLLDINIGPVVCLLGGVTVLSADFLAGRVTRKA